VLTLRPATYADVPAVVSIVDDAYAPYIERIGRPPAPMTVDYHELVATAEVWVAEDDGAAVGLLVVELRDDHLLVENLAVAPALQGHGVGSALLQHAESRAAALGLSEVRLYTNEAMTQNLNFYARRGYVEVGRGVQEGYRRVYFCKSLAAAPRSSSEVMSVWGDVAHLTSRFYAVPDGVRAGAGWFASLSLLPTTELNVCGLDPTADDASGVQLAALLGPDQPALVFTSRAASDQARQVLMDAGFDVAPVLEPVMCCRIAPQPTEGGFRISRCSTARELDTALDLTAAAHQVPRDLLSASIGKVAAQGLASVWLAYQGGKPVSAAWLTRAGSCIGVMEMMTPPEHQGRGAGRALLSQALHDEWDPSVTHSVLLSTPAGRRLYESLGFIAVDESLSCIRGLDDAVLDAIGQPRTPSTH
jgi:ribosomal protein S18 acetylase RimI-like enzyme